MADAMERLNRSLDHDFRLWPYDIQGSRAWAAALARASVLSPKQVAAIQTGLDTVVERLRAAPGPSVFTDEDVHSLVERLLTESIGADGGRLHTGRSRNDQVATDMRLWAGDACAHLRAGVLGVVDALAAQADEAAHLVMPGYTHLQRAQPIRVAHWLLAHAWPLLRDVTRLDTAAAAADVLPLGSGALAGCPFPVDRQALARALGFSQTSPNSLDATSDRDWMLDLAYACAMIGAHLSRLGEDLVLFSTKEFGFVRLDDAYTTGSSLMPQKRNPDVAELTRGASGLLLGDLVALLALVKGGPTGYNRDLQHDKAALFRQTDLLQTVLPAIAGAVATLRMVPKAMEAALSADLLATDAADHLVADGVPFRESHELVGRLVRAAEQRGLGLDELSGVDRAAIHPALESWVVDAQSYQRSADRRSVEGGTGRDALAAQRARLQQVLLTLVPQPDPEDT